MFKKILLFVVVVVAAICAYAATRPDEFRLTRETTIAAPPEKVYALLTDFTARGWGAWSPWEKLDPGMKRTFSGAPAGQGAIYGWKGADNVGEGRMEIVEAVPPSKVSIKLDFLKPFEAHNTAEFTLVPNAGSTRVTWLMFGPNTFLAKLMGVFFDMDTLVGKDFEAGLASLKTAAEK